MNKNNKKNLQSLTKYSQFLKLRQKYTYIPTYQLKCVCVCKYLAYIYSSTLLPDILYILYRYIFCEYIDVLESFNWPIVYFCPSLDSCSRRVGHLNCLDPIVAIGLGQQRQVRHLTLSSSWYTY